jgi:hypothetical protein
MENKLRSFPPAKIVNASKIMQEHNKIDHYWLENVFVPLFKSPTYRYNANEIA